MRQVSALALVAALAASLPAGSAGASDSDDLKALIADCGGPNVASSEIDSCLERARELGENDPSPQLEGLTARLERRAMALDDGNPEEGPQATRVAQDSSDSGGGSVTADISGKAAPHE